MTTKEACRKSLKFKIGIFFLVINIPFGLAGAAIGAALAASTGHTVFWTGFGIAIYAISWGMLGLGLLMAGKEGLAIAKELTRKFLRRP